MFLIFVFRGDVKRGILHHFPEHFPDSLQLFKLWFLFCQGVSQPFYGASPQLQKSAGKTRTLLLAPPVDSKHVRIEGKKGGKKAKLTFLESGAATGGVPVLLPIQVLENISQAELSPGLQSLSAPPRSLLRLILSEKSPANICNCREKEHCCLSFFLTWHLSNLV